MEDTMIYIAGLVIVRNVFFHLKYKCYQHWVPYPTYALVI